MSGNNIFEDTNPRKLSDLLALIHTSDMALPDFQRSFVWDPSATQELIISIASNYPAGSLLRVRNSNNLFAIREFEGAPAINGRTPSFLILDGQQRLTSLYQAFYGKGEHKFFIDLNLLLNGKDFEESIFHMRASKGKKNFGTLEKQVTNLILPLEVLYGELGHYHKWMDDVCEFKEKNEENVSQLRKQLRELHEKWIEPIEHYEFPVVTLTSNTTGDALCTIFETLNRTGVKLSVFELLTARFWPQGVNLRELDDNARKNNSLVEDFLIDPYYILQIISLLNPHKAASCKRSDLLDGLTAPLINENWDYAIQGLSMILKIISEDCGVLVPEWLPYTTILIPMAAVWAKQKDSKGVKVGSNRKKLVQWFWCSVFSQAYENSPNSQAAKDFNELNKWINEGPEPETVKNFSFDIDQLRETTPRQRAVYRGVMCLILRNGSIDFYEGKRISADLLRDKKIDDHHIFPDAYLEKNGVSKQQRDCVINRTLIDRNTNQSIGKRPPVEYLKDIERHIGKDVLKKIIKTHLIAEDISDLKGSFENFVEHRIEILRRHIEELTGKTIRKANGIFEKK